MPEKPSYEDLEQKLTAFEQEALRHSKAMEELQKREEKYRTIVDHSGEGIFVAQDGQIKFANLTTLTNAGYTSEELAATPFVEYIHPEDRELVYGRHIKRLQGQTLPSRYSFRIKDRSGDYLWVELNVVPIQWEGRPATLNVMRDITRQKQAEENLRSSEEKFRVMVEKSPIGIGIVNDRYQFIYANEKLCQTLGYMADEIVGSEFTSYLADESVKQGTEFYQRRQRGEAVPDRYLVTFVRKNGEQGYGEVQSNVYLDDAGRPNSIVQLSDITDRVKSEMERNQLEKQFLQAQKMESVGRLAGGVAHDFNNMLNVILGHAELATAVLDTQHPVQGDLEQIQNACRRSAELTQQLLAFARKQTIAPKILDLNDKVAGTIKMLQRLIGEDKELVWIPGHDIWPIKMDPAQMDQVLANLAVNAHDAITGVGKVVVETRNMVLDAIYCAYHAGFIPGEYVMLAVSDNGCGMDKETLNHIFEPFFTTKEIGRGTGLGLATVYGIIKQNLGFINVYSEPGEGSTFKLYFPRAMDKTAEKTAAVGDAAAMGGTETILMVEDEPAILSMGKSMLQRMGYSVHTAASPGEALRFAESYSGDLHLLITDVVMPEMNGRELAGRILPRFPGLKCLYMSGYTANVIAHRGVLDGNVNFIQKPFSSRDLDAKIREILKQEQ